MSRRRSIARFGGACLLALLLLVPLVSAGHHHGAEQAVAPHACKVCSLSHATLTPAGAPVVRPAFGLVGRSQSLATFDLVVDLDQDDHHGRAPPPASTRTPL